MRTNIRQLLIFTFMGGVSAAVDFGLYLFLTRLVFFFAERKVTASVVSALTAMTVGYLNHRRWTFRAYAARGFSFYSRFLAVYGLGVIWQNAVFAILIYALVWDWLAKIMAILAVAYGWNFILAKYWVFRYTDSAGIAVINSDFEHG